MTEILEDYVEHDGGASHLPKNLIGSLIIRSTGRGIFGSSVRTVRPGALKGASQVHKFIDAFFKSENVMAPVSGEWDSTPGMKKLDLPDLHEDAEVERMDFLDGGAVPAPPTSATTATPAEQVAFLRKQMNALDERVSDPAERAEYKAQSKR
jgi:hypothetical protein